VNNRYGLARWLECHVIELYDSPDMLISYPDYRHRVRRDRPEIKKDE
jgi:hypothetical protein